jgi:hypothetical protein
MKDLMAFQYGSNKEIIAQFHTTFFHDVENDAIHWMTKGVHYKVDFIAFSRLLGFGSGDRYADFLHSEKVKKPEQFAFAYERGHLADGETLGLKPFYYAMNNLFRETINPKIGDSTSIRKYARNLLARMGPGSDGFFC